MRQLNGVYTQARNKRYNKTGHLFHGRYKAILIQKDSHLLEVSRYVVLNPVCARLVEKPEDWKWSQLPGDGRERTSPSVPYHRLDTRTIQPNKGQSTERILPVCKIGDRQGNHLE